MVNVSFLDICISLLLTKQVKAIDIAKNVIEVLTFYEDQNPEIPILFRSKFDFVKILAEKRLSGLDTDCCIDDLSSVSRFQDLIPYIQERIKSPIADETLVSYIDRLRSRKKLISIYQNKEKIQGFLSQLDEEDFDGVDHLIENYETLVKKMFIDLVEHSRAGSIESISQVTFDDDDYGKILEQVAMSYDPSNSITTGYPELDSLMNGGFEPTRIYIVAAPSNVGKTNFLINFVLNAALTPSKELKTFLFITLENLVHENIVRMYCKLFRKTVIEATYEVRKGVNIIQKIEDKLKEANSKLVMKYYPTYSISPIDLMIDLDEMEQKYGTKTKALYVDYLDLMRSDISSKETLYRLELGFIALSLKTLAIKYNLPVVTVSQLNRMAYDITNEPGVENIGESIKKVEHSDWVGLLTEDPGNRNLRHLKIGKNRSGPKGFRISFDVNFTYYDVIRVRESTSFEEALRTMDNHYIIENPLQEEPSRRVRISGDETIEPVDGLLSEYFS